MNPRERGFLLLTAYLGNPERKPLTVAQFRDLGRAMAVTVRPEMNRELTPEDLLAIGYNRQTAQRIMSLLEETELLDHYLSKAKRAGCVPITRVSNGYPLKIRRALGLEAPGVLWAKGDIALLRTPIVALVGSRELLDGNIAFAEAVGKQAALQGYTLVSGNARGADRIAQNSCLLNGGKVISVVADKLETHEPEENVLYLSEDGYDLPFSAYRALKRNRIIHSMGDHTFVAGCRLEKGGTWEGTKANLRHGYSPVFCFNDGSDASLELQQLGAKLISVAELNSIQSLHTDMQNFMDQ